MGTVVTLNSAPAFSADRNTLMAELRGRLAAGGAPSVLVVFGFVGLKEYERVVSQKASDSLLEWFGATIARVIGGSGAVFRTRRHEYFALIEGDGDYVRGLVTKTRSELDRVGRPCDVRACFGFTLLPGEARFPTQALAVADERLRAMVGDLRPEPA
jgi:hypothetical protein